MYLFPGVVIGFCVIAFLFLVYFLATVKTGELSTGPRKAIRKDSNKPFPYSCGNARPVASKRCY